MPRKKTEAQIKKEREEEAKLIRECKHPIHGGSYTLSGGLKKSDLVEIQFKEGKKHLPGKYRPNQKVFVTASLADQWCDVSDVAVRTGDKTPNPGVVTRGGGQGGGQSGDGDQGGGEGGQGGDGGGTSE